MKKFHLAITILLATYTIYGQSDTINALPYAQIILPKGEWLIPAPSNTKLFERLKLKNQTDFNSELRLRIKTRTEEITSMAAFMYHDLNLDDLEQANDMGIERTFEYTHLRDSIFAMALTMKPTECADQDELRFLKDGMTMRGAYIKLNNYTVLAIEMDYDEIPSKEQLTNAALFIDQAITGLRLLTPQQADSLAHYPINDEYMKLMKEKYTRAATEEERSEIIYKMNCMDSRSVRDNLRSSYGKAYMDSIYALSDAQLIEELYFKSSWNTKSSAELIALMDDSTTQYTYKEHLLLKEKVSKTVYPLSDYMNAKCGIRTGSDFERLSVLDGSISTKEQYVHALKLLTQHNIKLPNSPYSFEQSTYMEALSQQLFSGKLQVLKVEEQLTSTGMWLLLTCVEDTMRTNHAVIATVHDSVWSLAQLELPEITQESEQTSWNMIQTNCDALHVLHSDNSQNYYVHYSDTDVTTQQGWLTIDTHQVDTTAFIKIAMERQVSYTGDNNSAKTDWYLSTMKKRGLYEHMIDDLLPHALPFEEFSENYYETIFEITSGKFVHEHRISSWLLTELKPTDIAHSTSLSIGDLDQDSLPELYHYALSNGKVIYAEVYKLTDKGIVKLSKGKALKLLEQHNFYHSDRIQSLYGNYQKYSYEK
ncbi:MAG: hypothetical protein ACKVOR_08135 [Flavobacteriales bacterium]